MDQVFNMAEEEGEEEESGPTESTGWHPESESESARAAVRAAEESTIDSNCEKQDEGEEKGKRSESEQ